MLSWSALLSSHATPHSNIFTASVSNQGEEASFGKLKNSIAMQYDNLLLHFTAAAAMNMPCKAPTAHYKADTVHQEARNKRCAWGLIHHCCLTWVQQLVNCSMLLLQYQCSYLLPQQLVPSGDAICCQPCTGLLTTVPSSSQQDRSIPCSTFTTTGATHPTRICG